MSSHPFDRLAASLARGMSRRAFLSLMAHLAVGAAAHRILLAPPVARARHSVKQGSSEPQPPPPFWPPDFPLDPPGRAIDDYVECIAQGNTPEDCDKGVPWCEIREYILNRAFPHITGLLEVANPFGEDCGTTDCLQCCYVPNNNGCHSSFIGEDVINCTPRIYGPGTRGVGLTLLLDEPPPDGTCLFTPQVCTHVGICLQGSEAEGGAGAQLAAAPLASATNYLTDPRAIKQRARVFAMYALAQARHYLDDYATDSPDAAPLQSLHDAVFGRGWATWRQDMAGLILDLNDPLFRVTDSAGNLIESASNANVWRTFALLRLLTGLPGLAARLEHVESRVWSADDITSYLAAIPDPDAALEESLDPHIVGILKRIPSLQDYRLLAVPLAGEPDSSGRYGGMPLGQPPTLRLSAAGAGLTVTLTATLDDPTDGGLARPLAVDWGDGRSTRHELPAGQAMLTVSHDYASPGRYAIYAVSANNSGLRGAACVVVEADTAGGAPAQTSAAPLTLVRAGLLGLTVHNLPYTRDMRLALSFADAAGATFLAGRSRVASGPTNITAPVDLGDAYAHNPSRLDVTALIVTPRHNLTAPSGGRIPSFTVSSLALGVFSTAQMRTVDQVLPLSAGMLAVYLEGETAPLPETALTVNGDGTITVPLLYRATTGAPWQRVERIEIAITSELFDGFVLDATPTALATGTSAAWVERRPGAFTPVQDEQPSPSQQHHVYLPSVQR